MYQGQAGMVKKDSVEKSLMDAQCSTVGCRQSAGEEVRVLVEQLSIRAGQIAGLVADRLTPIQREADCKSATGVPVDSLPPYFNQVRANLFSIQESLRQIEDSILRVDL